MNRPRHSSTDSFPIPNKTLPFQQDDKTTATDRFQITGKILKLYCSAWRIGDGTIISNVCKAGTMTIQTNHSHTDFM